MWTTDARAQKTTSCNFEASRRRCATLTAMLLNVTLSLTNVSALVAIKLLYSVRTPTPRTPAGRRLLATLLLASGLFSAAYHLCEHAVRRRGLAGIGAPRDVEAALLSADRAAAVALAAASLLRARSVSRLRSALTASADLLAAAALAGALSEVPPVAYGAAAVAASVVVPVGASLRGLAPQSLLLTNGTLACSVLMYRARADVRYVVLHGLWHVFVYQSVPMCVGWLWQKDE